MKTIDSTSNNGLDQHDAGIIIGHNIWESKQSLILRKLGLLEKEISDSMARALELRPLAEAILAKSQATKGRTFEYKKNPRIFCHTDMFSSDGEIIEIRCGQKAYAKALRNKQIPKPYWAEAQHILLVTEEKSLKLLFFNPEGTFLQFHVKADKRFMETLLKEEEAFLQTLDQERTILLENMKKTQKAAQRKGSKVAKDIYQTFVPKYIDRSGRFTEQGQILLKTLEV